MNTEKLIVFFNTNHADLPGQSYKTGVYMPNLVLPVFELVEAGFKNIKFASPKGGVTPIDEDSMKRYGTKDPYTRFLNDPKWMEKLKNSMKPSDFGDGRDIAAIIFTGGCGSLWDLYDDKLAKLAANVYDNNGIVAAIDCGGVVLPKIVLKSGKKLIDNKRITCISNQELDELKLGDILPRRVEDVIKEQSEAKILLTSHWENNVVVDGRLVTGQNFASSTTFGKKVVELLRK